MAEIAHAKRKHATFAPSASDRWMACPGSVELSKGAPPQKENPWAIEGTRAHECLEFIMRRYANLKKAEEQARTTMKLVGGKQVREWDTAMVDHAINSAKVILDLKPSRTAKLLIETRSRATNDVYGSLDYAWVDEWGWLIVIDYKYGAGHPVLPIDEEGEENTQLMCYAVGIAKRFNYEFDGVKLAIIQPRVWKDDENPLTIGETTIKRVREFERKINRAVLNAKQPAAKLTAGDHCKWCPASSFCPEISKGQLDKAGVVFDVEEGITKLPKLEALKPANLSVVLSACKSLETWIASVKAYAQTIAEDGEKIPGYKLVQKKSIRSWLPIAEEKLAVRIGDKAFEKKLLSPAQLEKRLGKAAKIFTEKYTTTNSSGYTLVRASDKRREIESTLSFDVDV